MTCWDGRDGCLKKFPLQCIDWSGYEDLFIGLGFNHYNLKVQNKYCLLHNSPFKLKTNQLRNPTCRFEEKYESEINSLGAKYKKKEPKPVTG